MTCHFLEGIHVLDFSDDKSCFCAEMVARLGATVQRIGRNSGLGPEFETGVERPTEDSTGADSGSNLGDADSGEMFPSVLGWADVVILDGEADKLGPLRPYRSSLPSLKPSLITVHVSDFGPAGPYRDYVSCNLVAAALGGQMCWRLDGDSPPVLLSGEQAYRSASLFATIGMLLAIIARDNSRLGNQVDVSLHEAAAAVVECSAIGLSPRSGRRPLRRFSDSFDFVSCADGYVVVSLDPASLDILSALVSQGAEKLDQGFTSGAFALSPRELWSKEDRAIVGRWAGTLTRKEVWELGQLMRLPWAPVFSAEEAANSPQHVERRFLATDGMSEIQHRGGATTDRQSIRHLPFIVTSDQDGGFSSSCRDEKALSAEQYAPRLCHQVSWSYPGSTALDKSEAPLCGVRVLDLSRLVAGPYATRILADYGAEVIKIQSRKTATGAEANLSPSFVALNRNKLSVTLDMDYPEARATFLRLVELSDVVIENYTPRVMTNWGLGYHRLKEMNEKAIMVRMSAMGQTGPWRDYAGLAPTIHAFSGIVAMNSEASAPVSIPFPYADIASALYAVIGTLGALRRRHVTGLGCLIDLSEYESMCSLLPAEYVGALSETPIRRAPTRGSPEGCLKCSGDDEWCAVAVFSNRQWNGLCRALGNPPWTRDERYRTHNGRCRSRGTLNALVQEWTIAREASSVMESLQSQGVPCGIVRSPEGLLTDPQLADGGFLIELNHPAIGPHVSFESPIRLRGLHTRQHEPSPLLGQHNQYVFGELLGMSDGLIASYAERGAFS